MTYNVLFNDPAPDSNKLNEEQKEKLFASFEELHPYLKDCYIMYQGCPRTKLSHCSIVFNFKENTKLDIESLSEEIKELWGLNDLQNVLDKQENEMTIVNGCQICFGIPPIRRILPERVLDLLNFDKSKYHVSGNEECFMPLNL